MKYLSFLSLLMFLVLVVGCDEEQGGTTEPTEMFTIEGWETFDEVNSGTFQFDSTYWLVTATKLTNTVGIATNFQIYVKKAALRQRPFALSLPASDFSIIKSNSYDEPGGAVTNETLDDNPSFTIQNIKSETLFATFSASSLEGKITGLPLNLQCVTNAWRSPPCPLDLSYFKPVIFSVYYLYTEADVQAVDSEKAQILASFSLPFDTTSLKNNFLLLENNSKSIGGNLKISPSRSQAYFLPKQTLQRNTSYTAKIAKGVLSGVSNTAMQDDYELNFKTSCANPPVANILFATGLTVQVGDSTIQEKGSWSIIEGSNGMFTDNNTSYTKFTGIEHDVYQLRWTPSNGCAASDIRVDLSETVSDYEGNFYHAVSIGDQVWLGENLRSQKDANGEPIPGIKERGDFIRTGRYYPWWAAMNKSDSSSTNPSGIQGICPNGWHLPSDKEYQELLDFGATDGRPVHLLLKDETSWGNGLDAFGFGAITAGTFTRYSEYRSSPTLIWSTNKAYTSHVSAMTLTADKVYLAQFNDYEASASVRCVKD